LLIHFPARFTFFLFFGGNSNIFIKFKFANYYLPID